MPSKAPKRFTTRRLRILWIVMGALLLVSVTPLWLYHRQALHLSEGKLQDTERVQQSEITRSLASETLQFEQSLREQLLSQRQMLALTGWIQDVNDPSHAPQLARLLQVFVENNADILYVTAVNREAKGPSAGSVSADRDPFVEAVWKRAFTSSMQGFDSLSEPFALGEGNRPALVVSLFARMGTVDHTPYDTASILRLLRRRFDLEALPGLNLRDRSLAEHGEPPMGDLTNALELAPLRPGTKTGSRLLVQRTRVRRLRRFDRLVGRRRVGGRRRGGRRRGRWRSATPRCLGG